MRKSTCMVDEYTRGGVRRKRPDLCDPGETFAQRARQERQARLRVPLRAQLDMDDVHGDIDATKADIRDHQEDGSREKNATRRDKENEAYAKRRERVLDKWEDKAERRERRLQAKIINDARKKREERRNSMFDDERLDIEPMLHIASPETLAWVGQQIAQLDQRKPAKPKPLLEQIEHHGIAEVLQPKHRNLLEESSLTDTKRERSR